MNLLQSKPEKPFFFFCSSPFSQNLSIYLFFFSSRVIFFLFLVLLEETEICVCLWLWYIYCERQSFFYVAARDYYTKEQRIGFLGLKRRKPLFSRACVMKTWLLNLLRWLKINWFHSYYFPAHLYFNKNKRGKFQEQKKFWRKFSQIKVGKWKIGKKKFAFLALGSAQKNNWITLGVQQRGQRGNV